VAALVAKEANKRLDKMEGPAAKKLRELRERKEKLDKYRANVDRMSEFLRTLTACVSTAAAGNCMERIAKTVTDENREFIQSLGDEGIGSAAERVGRASDLVRGYASRLNGSAQGGALAAQKCLAEQIEFQQQLASAEAAAPVQAPVAAGGGASTEPAPVRVGGSNSGKVLLATAAVVGAAAAVASALPKTDEPGACPTLNQCCGGGGGGGGCGIPAQCECPRPTVSGGICQAGGGCSRFVNPGDRVCNGC
jgi:hypothetical protein